MAATTYETFKRQALSLPEVEESTSYGTPALKVRGKLMARLKEDGETVVVRTDWESREQALAIYPEVFFITEHYRKYPWVLVRLPKVKAGQLRQALALAWRLSAPKSLVARVSASSDRGGI